jgi:hypothetical protein
MRICLDEGWEDMLREDTLMNQSPPEYTSMLAFLRASAARIYSRLGNDEVALLLLEALLVPLTRASGSTVNYPWIACDAAAALWQLGRIDHVEVIERNLHEKVIVPDFRYPMRDGRLAMAQLCALQERYDDAVEWFAKARVVLDDEGARPLRAVVDFDEALMCRRRDDRTRAASLAEVALEQFRAVGMSGWVTRAEALLSDCGGSPIESRAEEGAIDDTPPNTPPIEGETAGRMPAAALLRREAEYWAAPTTDRRAAFETSKVSNTCHNSCAIPAASSTPSS